MSRVQNIITWRKELIYLHKDNRSLCYVKIQRYTEFMVPVTDKGNDRCVNILRAGLCNYILLYCYNDIATNTTVITTAICLWYVCVMK
jgi:hypothetical protein